MFKLILVALLSVTLAGCQAKDVPSRAEHTSTDHFTDSDGFQQHMDKSLYDCYRITKRFGERHPDSNPSAVYWTCLHMNRAVI